MNMRLFKAVWDALWTPEFRGSQLDKNKRSQLQFLISVVLLLSITPTGQVAGGVGKELTLSSTRNIWKDGQSSSFQHVYRIAHLGPERSTVGHDYYEAKTNAFIRALIHNVEANHVKHILPNIKVAYRLHPNLKKGRLEQALREIEYTLHRIVNHPKALALSATVASMLDRPNLPITFYQKAIHMYPKRAMPHAQFGNFLVSVGKVEEGIERLKIAIKLNPKLGVAYSWLAWTYHEKGELELVEKYVKRAREQRFRGKLPQVKAP